MTAGEDFAKVAAEVSASPSKANGGLIGPMPLKELSPALQRPADQDEAGRDHAADAGRQGFQILKLEKLTTPVTQPFESVRDLVADKVYARASRRK